MIESQVQLRTGCLRLLAGARPGSIEVRPSAQRSSTTAYPAPGKDGVEQGGCKSWYLDEHGVNRTLWPGWTWDFRRRTRRFDPEPYILAPSPEQAPAPPPAEPVAA